jgi:hypothetical protein
MEDENTQRYLPDVGITQDDARILLDQFMSQQLSEDDFWWSLGFDFYDRKPKNKTNDLLQGGVKIRYLINAKKQNNVAHIWLNGDTACCCYANGSLGRKQTFEVTDTTNGREVCRNCLNKI